MKEHRSFHPWYEGMWHLRYVSDGKTLWEEDIQNTLVNEGEKNVLNSYFRNTESPTTFYARLCRDSLIESSTLNTISNEPSSTYGYAPCTIERSATGWPTIEVDSLDWRVVSKEISWTASGGDIGPVNTCFLATSSDNTGLLIAYLNLPVERTILDGDTLYAYLRVKAK